MVSANEETIKDLTIYTALPHIRRLDVWPFALIIYPISAVIFAAFGVVSINLALLV